MNREEVEEWIALTEKRLWEAHLEGLIEGDELETVKRVMERIAMAFGADRRAYFQW